MGREPIQPLHACQVLQGGCWRLLHTSPPACDYNRCCSLHEAASHAHVFGCAADAGATGHWIYRPWGLVHAAHHGGPAVGGHIRRHVAGRPVGYILYQSGIPVAGQQGPLWDTNEVVQALAKLEQQVCIWVLQAGRWSGASTGFSTRHRAAAAAVTDAALTTA
jgi:hypothetical protein